MIEARLTDGGMIPRPNPAGRIDGLAPRPTPGHHSGPNGIPPTMTDSLLTIAWRSRRIVLICVIVALAAGIGYIQTTTPIYKSTAKLWLDYATLRISNAYDAGGRPQTDKYLSTQAEIIQSTPIVAAAAEALAPQQLRTLAGVEIPAAYLQRHIGVSVGKKDEIISVSLSSPYPVEAAAIVNHLVNAYMAFRSDREQKSSSEVLETLQYNRELIRKELEGKREELRNFEQSNMPLALGSDQGAAVVQRLLEWQQDSYAQARFETTEAESFRNSVELLKDDQSALRHYLQTRGKANVAAEWSAQQVPLESRITELELTAKGLSETFTTDHPRIAGLTIEIEQIRKRLTELNAGFADAVLAAARQQYADAKAREAQLAAEYAQEQERFKKVNAELTQHETLRSEVDALAGYVQKLDDEIREISKITGEEDIGQLTMAILEPAFPAETPTEPQKGRVMAVALLLGLLSGGIIAVGRDWLDQGLRSPDEISALLGLPVLGVVPPMSRRQRVQERGQKVLLQPESHEAEAFRMVRTAVFFGSAKDSARTMLITSPTAGDGKSTLASNLAIAIAHAGQKTLILDADMRRPTQHAIFDVEPRDRCLANVLSGRMKLGAAIQPTGVRNLHLLTYGNPASNPTEVLNSPRFARVLSRLTEGYDRVIVDAPPVTVVADARIIAALTDVSILVLRADKSTRRMAQRAVTALRSVHAHLMGVVVNEVHRSSDGCGEYYGRLRDYYGPDSNTSKRSKAKSTVVLGPPARNGILLRSAAER